MSIFSDLIERVALAALPRARRTRARGGASHTSRDGSRVSERGTVNPSDDAYRSSAIALGGIERVKDDVRDARGTRPLHDIWRDIGFGARTLASNPSFTLVTLATLAIGIGGTTAVFSAVDAVLLQPLPYAEPGQLVRLFQHRDDQPDDRGVVTPVHFVELRRRTGVVCVDGGARTLQRNGRRHRLGRRRAAHSHAVDDRRLLRRRPRAAGDRSRLSTRMKKSGPTSSILSHELWVERFGGDPAAVGRTLTMSGRPFTIIGVMPAGYRDPLIGSRRRTGSARPASRARSEQLRTITISRCSRGCDRARASNARRLR